VNGWHPHAHHLVFAKGAHNHDDMKAVISSAWAKACVKAGLKSPSAAHGVDVRGGDYASAYVGKWGLEHEMTKAHIKKGRSGGHTPFDLLRLLVKEPEQPNAKQVPALFREYAQAFHGKRQLYWSDGLRPLLGLAAEVTDEEAVTGEDSVAEVLATLTDDQWRWVLRKNLRGQLLEAVNASGGSASAVANFLDSVADCQPASAGAAGAAAPAEDVEPKRLASVKPEGSASLGLVWQLGLRELAESEPARADWLQFLQAQARCIPQQGRQEFDAALAACISLPSKGQQQPARDT